MILALGTGCKDDNSGRGIIDDDGGVEDGGGGDAGGGGNDAGGGSNDAGGGSNDAGGGKDAGGDLGDAGGGSDAGGDNDAGGGSNDAGGDGNDASSGNDAGDSGTTDSASPDSGQPDSGTGEALLDKISIEFGNSPCGGDAPASQSVTLTNFNGASLSYTVTLSNTTAFSIQDDPDGTVTGTIDTGASATLTFNAAAVPASATADQAIVGTATVTTNLPAPYNSFVVPLSVVPQGAHLALSAAGAPSWLLVQARETAAPKTVTVVNTGNSAANVTVAQPDEGAFSLRYNDAPASMFAVPAASNGNPGSTALSAGFTPQVIRAYTDEVALTVAGPVCNGGQAASITSIPFQGAATGEGLTLDITDAFENRVNCGATGSQLPKATIQVRNNTTSNQLISVTTIAGAVSSPFSLSKSTLNVPTGQTDSFDVTLLASYATSAAVPRTELFDTLLISPQGSGVNPIIRTLSTVVQGAVLSVTAPPAFLNGTNVSPVTQQVMVSNTGNLPASPSFSIGGTDASRFAVTLSPTEIPVSGDADVSVTFTPPVGDSTAKNATLIATPGMGDVICAPAPAPTALTGTASTSGFQLVGSAPIFQPVCPVAGATIGQTFVAGNQVLTIQNVGNANMKWTAAVDDPSRFAIDLMGTPILTEQHDLAMGATADINVVPAPLTFPALTTADNYGATLTIITEVPGDVPHPIRLVQTAQGAVIALSGTPLSSFPDVNVSGESTQEQLFALVNSGNVDTIVTATADVTAMSGHAAYYVGSDFAAVGHTGVNAITLASDNTPVPVSGLFDPVYPDNMLYDENLDLGAKGMQIGFTAPGPFCAALPAPLSVTTNATNAVSSISTVAVDFSASPADRQTCGGVRAARPKTIVVTNYGNQPLTIDNVSLDVGGAAFFTAYVNSVGMTTAVVDPAIGGVPGSAVVVVSPKLIADTSSGSHTGTATLTISTSVGGTPTSGIDVLPTIALSNTVVCP